MIPRTGAHNNTPKEPTKKGPWFVTPRGLVESRERTTRETRDSTVPRFSTQKRTRALCVCFISERRHCCRGRVAYQRHTPSGANQRPPNNSSRKTNIDRGIRERANFASVRRNCDLTARLHMYVDLMMPETFACAAAPSCWSCF